ncbi:MAG TPA: SPFH domain-containing protein [Rhodanobacteraceae bacterium]|jgi:membrane protease subunit HflC|nr:SPFH domain-containing protein [Rhodanobacteraceae bacterium]
MKYALPIVILVLALLGANSIFVVGEGHAAVLSRFGRMEASGIGPGLHFKLPFVQDVSVYDTRQIISQAEPGDCKTRDGHAVRVGFHVLWQIADAATYFKATSGDELQATQQIEPLVRNALRSEVADSDLSALLAAAGQDMGAKVRSDVSAALRRKLGVDVLAVSIGRVLPPDEALASVYKRMTTEAQAAAGSVRAQGEAEAAAIRAQGDADNEQVLDAASKAAAAIRGDGDADAAKIYAAASAKDPQFFRYWSALDAWRTSFSGGGAVVVLDKGSPFMQAVDAGAASENATPKKP